MEKYKVIDLFAGAGGLSNGFEQTDKFEVIGAVEINKDAIKTYIHNHDNNQLLIIKPNNSDVSDITKIDFKDYVDSKNINSDEIVVIGGPPCQGFSNANRQKNYLISGNNQLVKEFVRAIDEIRPIAFLMENVKTMNSETHKFFVTEMINETSDYSSERHLRSVFGESFKEKVEIEKLKIMEFEDSKYKSLINELISNNVQPFLMDENLISRVRGVVRKLKAPKKALITVKRDIIELKSIITILESLDFSYLESATLIKNIFKNVIATFECLLAGGLEDDAQALEALAPFLTINQTLRYLKELKDERILCITEPEVEDEGKGGSFTLTVEVATYNIVQYLKAFFEYIEYEFDEDVIKSNDFFVPQRRERYMFLGVKKDRIKAQVKLPQPYVKDQNYFTVKDAIEDLEEIEPNKNIEDAALVYKSDIQPRMVRYYRNLEDNLILNHVNTDSEELSLERFKYINENEGKNFHSLPEHLKSITYANNERTQNTVYLRLNYDVPSPTVINVRKSMWQHPKKIRAISIREAARLQSFKDKFEFKGSKDKQYQQIGNAVPPLMARAVAESMLKALGKQPKNYLIDEF